MKILKLNQTATFIDLYPNDLATQTKLLLEFDKLLLNLTPEKLFSKRFYFLVEYFQKNGSLELQDLCTQLKGQL